MASFGRKAALIGGIVAGVVAFPPAAVASSPTVSAYDETAGMHEVVAAVLGGGDFGEPAAQRSAAGGASSDSPSSSSSDRPKSNVAQALSSKFEAAQLTAQTPPSPFTPGDAGVMGVAAAVLAGSGALMLGAGLGLGRREPERYDEL